MNNDSSHLPMSIADLLNVFQEVQTERLLLRRPQLEDAAAMFMVHGDPQTNCYNPHGPDPDRETSEEVLREWMHQWEDEGFGYWTVILKQTKDIIGFGGIRSLVWRDRAILNLYYRLTPSAWRQGYATELAQKAVSLARTYLPHRPIVAKTRSANTPSIRTAQKAGLQRRSDLDTEHVIFALGWPPI